MLQNNRAYLSHSIRGKLGVNATPESMAANNGEAHEAAVLMRAILPEVHIYVPGEHDEVISLLYQGGRLKEEDILWADCQLIKHTCQILIAYSPDGYISTGMMVEIKFARNHNIPVYIVAGADDLAAIKSEILEYLSGKK